VELHPETRTVQDSSTATVPVFTLIFAIMLNTFRCLD